MFRTNFYVCFMRCVKALASLPALSSPLVCARFLSTPALNNTAHFILENLPSFNTFVGGATDFSSPLPAEDIFFPWVGSFTTPSSIDKMHDVIIHDKEYLRNHSAVRSFEWRVSNLLLMPSPGEKFQLHVGLLGQFLANVTNPVSVQVCRWKS